LAGERAWRVKEDTTKVQAEEEHAEPRQNRYVVLGEGFVGHHSQPVQPGMIEKPVFDQRSDKHEQDRESQIQCLEAQEQKPQYPANKYEVQYAEDDPGKGKNQITGQGHQSRGRSQNGLAAEKRPKTQAVPGGQKEAGAYGQEKAGHDQGTHSKPEGIGLEGNACNAEIVEIKTEMVQKHEQDGRAPERVQCCLAGRWDAMSILHDMISTACISMARLLPVHVSRIVGKACFTASWRLSGLAAVLFLSLFGACAPTHEPVVSKPEPVHALTLEKPFGLSMTLEEYLNQVLARQYPAAVRAFSPPDRPGEYFVELAHEPAVIHLAAGVRSYAARATGLAAGLDNGDILIWSDWPCPALTLPEAAPVDLLTWDGTSAFLGASDTQRKMLHIFDLRLCALVDAVPSENGIAVATVSASGDRIALVDQRRQLLAGAVGDGSLRQAGVLRFHPLALGFSPREGLLFSVDQAGWLLHWTVPELQILKQVLISHGPFSQAFFADRRLFLEPMRQEAGDGLQDEKTPLVVWDIPTSKAVAANDQQAREFDLEAGLLTHQTSENRWLRKMHLGRPQPRVWASPSAGRLRLRDLDGVFRCYSALDGLPVNADQCQREDWEEVPVNTAGRFLWGGVKYAMADPVMIHNGQVLFCRSLSKGRFFLWWEEVEKVPESGQGMAVAQGGKLPIRESLRLEIPPDWIPVPHQ